jgi:hypothetical protein
MEGISTTKDAFQVWKIPPPHQRHKAQYNPSSAPMNGKSTYSDAFVQKTTSKYVHPSQIYVANVAKFEGKSTNKTDFPPTGKIIRRENFAPKNAYAMVGDDRDFLSTAQLQYTPKVLPVCPSATRIGTQTAK